KKQMKRGHPLNHYNPLGIYLAAGSSRRFGKDKLNQRLNEKPLGTLGLEAALKSNLQKVGVVTKQAVVPWLTPFIDHPKCDRIKCHQAHVGQAHSIHSGLRYAEEDRADAVVVMLADQPFIDRNILNTLIETHKNEQQEVSFVATRHNGITCPPVLFSYRMFPELYTLDGDNGAKYLLTKKASEGIFLDIFNGKTIRDIDTPQDYEHAFNEGITKRL